MEDYELALKLLGYKEVWEEHSFLFLDDNGVPRLICDYKVDKNALTIHKEWTYKDNKWREL